MITREDFGEEQNLVEGLPSISILHQENLQNKKDLFTKTDLARSYYQLGKIYYDKADLEKAEEAFLQALSFTSDLTDYFTILKTYGFLIRLTSEKLDDEKATKYILESEKVIQTLKEQLPVLNAEFYYYQGVVKNYSGEFELAREDFMLAYEKSSQENEPELLSKCLLALATNAFYRNDYTVALRFLDQLNDLLKIIKKYYLTGAMYNYYGKIYIEFNEHEKAMEAFKNANEYLQSKKCWNLYGYILLGKAISLKKAGHFDESLKLFQMAKESIDSTIFKRLNHLIEIEIDDVTDSTVDLFLDRANRKIVEKTLGTIDFKHRFVLLEILFLLSKNVGKFYDKEQLAKMIWKDEYNPLIHDKLIYTSVSRLRKLIEPEGVEVNRKYIIRGKDGYTFNPLTKIRFHLESKANSERSIGNVDLSSPV